eukprot:5219954-Pyramimonas_sp.AAC.1
MTPDAAAPQDETPRSVYNRTRPLGQWAFAAVLADQLATLAGICGGFHPKSDTAWCLVSGSGRLSLMCHQA